jgi:pumilio RNA-binding family
VLRKIIELLSPQCSSFIIEEILENGLDGVKEVAMHRYGCRIMEELLRVCHPTQLNDMIELLLADCEVLCMHMFGNFVMKSVLRCALPRQRQTLVKSIMDNLLSIGTSFYACAVLVEVLQGDKAEGQALARMILSVAGLLSAIVKNKHGRSVLEFMMVALEDDQRRVLVNELQAPPLKGVKAFKSPKK